MGVITKKGEINQSKITVKSLLVLPDELHPIALAGFEKCFGVRKYGVFLLLNLFSKITFFLASNYKDICDKIWYFTLCIKHVDKRLYRVP